jgi:hypothetical protein
MVSVLVLYYGTVIYTMCVHYAKQILSYIISHLIEVFSKRKERHSFQLFLSMFQNPKFSNGHKKNAIILHCFET